MIVVDDRVVLIPLKDGGYATLGLPVSTVIDDRMVIVTAKDGGKYVLRLSTPFVGDKVLMLPLKDGGYVAVPAVPDGEFPEWFDWTFFSNSYYYYGLYDYGQFIETRTPYTKRESKGAITHFQRTSLPKFDSGHLLTECLVERDGYQYTIVRYPPPEWNIFTPMRKTLLEVDFRVTTLIDTCPRERTFYFSISTQYGLILGYVPHTFVEQTSIDSEIHTATVFVEDNGWTTGDFGGYVLGRVAYDGVIDPDVLKVVPRYYFQSNYMRNPEIDINYKMTTVGDGITTDEWDWKIDMEILDARGVSKYGIDVDPSL